MIIMISKTLPWVVNIIQIISVLFMVIMIFWVLGSNNCEKHVKCDVLYWFISYDLWIRKIRHWLREINLIIKHKDAPDCIFDCKDGLIEQ